MSNNSIGYDYNSSFYRFNTRIKFKLLLDHQSIKINRVTWKYLSTFTVEFKQLEDDKNSLNTVQIHLCSHKRFHSRAIQCRSFHQTFPPRFNWQITTNFPSRCYFSSYIFTYIFSNFLRRLLCLSLILFSNQEFKEKEILIIIESIRSLFWNFCLLRFKTRSEIPMLKKMEFTSGYSFHYSNRPKLQLLK